jgi:hypothetical protein
VHNHLHSFFMLTYDTVRTSAQLFGKIANFVFPAYAA